MPAAKPKRPTAASLDRAANAARVAFYMADDGLSEHLLRSPWDSLEKKRKDRWRAVAKAAVNACKEP